MLITLYYFTIFSAAAAAALSLERIFADYLVPLRILVVLVLILLIILQRNLSEELFSKRVFQGTLLFITTLFVILLVVTTGGFLSPFFVIVHITTLGLAFILTFGAAVAFLGATLAALAFHFFSAFQAGIVSLDIPLLIVYLLSIAAIIPFSWVVASRYHLRGKIADFLSRELFASRREEEAILGNIEEGVITLDPTLRIVRLNNIAQRLTGFREELIKKRPFFSVFSFKDEQGKVLAETNFPISNLATTKWSFRETTLSMSRANGIFFRVDFKFSSIVDRKSVV